MSLATLKKKTQTKYNNMSVNSVFNLNGTTRNQGYIGQTSYTIKRANVAPLHLVVTVNPMYFGDSCTWSSKENRKNQRAKI